MNQDEIFGQIKTKRPTVIYIGGKTSTGKSTFANRLRAELGYEIMELDEVVKESVIKPLRLDDRNQVFVEVYRKRNKMEWIDRFVASGQEIIGRHITQKQPLVLEGALANPQTLQDLFSQCPELCFIYFHPTNLEDYKRNLLSRFNETTPTDRGGLPNGFWKPISKESLVKFYNDHILTPELESAIEQYASDSSQESKDRLAGFEKCFQNIDVVEV